MLFTFLFYIQNRCFCVNISSVIFDSMSFSLDKISNLRKKTEKQIALRELEVKV